MLVYIWFGIFIVFSAYAAGVSNLKGNIFEGDSFNWAMYAAFSSVMSLVITWDEIGFPYWMLIRNWMPDSGTTLSELTALLILAISGTIFMGLVLSSGFYISEILKKKTLKVLKTGVKHGS